MKIKKELAAVVFGLGCFLLIEIAAYFGIFHSLQLTIANNLYSAKPTTDEIIIVKIDEASRNDDIGLGHFSTWTRDLYAKVIDNINQYDPAVIAFDVEFKSTKEAETDQQFVDSLRNAENPVVVFRLYNPIYEEGKFVSRDQSNMTLEDIANLPNVNIAFSNLITNGDQIIRSIPVSIFDEVSNTEYKSFSLEIARLYLGKEPAVPTENGQMLINYNSLPVASEENEFQYKTISFLHVHDGFYGKDPFELFKDKIVLIGATDPYFKDEHLTPIYPQILMPGVEIHANAIQTILDQNFLRNESILEKMLVIFVLCMLGAFVFMLTRIRWSVLFLVLVMAGYTVAAPLMFERGVILDLIYPYLALVLAFISVYIYRYLTEFKEKKLLRSAFSKYVSPDVVEQISNNPEQLKLGGDKREITILFSDIAHFTSISEKLKPESLVAMLNEYLQVMSEVIKEEGGTLDKFEGDAIMAFFGAPIEHKDHAVRACSTLIKMRRKLEEMNEKWKSDPPLPGGEKKPQVDFRCGINTGQVIVGNFGSEDRFDYTAIGDAVNLASRLEGANKNYETNMMISADTYERVSKFFVARELDLIKVVGKDEPITVYELLGRHEDVGDEANQLLSLYNEGIALYHGRKFEDALAKFDEILEQFPGDGPSKLYRQRCEVLRNFPPPENWDGVFQMRQK